MNLLSRAAIFFWIYLNLRLLFHGSIQQLASNPKANIQLYEFTVSRY